jgi:hypothetical protein
MFAGRLLLILTVKCERLWWTAHLATEVCEELNAYRILVVKPLGKRPFERPRRKWEDNIKMKVTEMGWEDVR